MILHIPKILETLTKVVLSVKPEVKIMIPIPEGFQVQGSVIAEQVRSLDLNTRWWKTTGKVLPKPFVDEVVETLNLIIGS